MNSKNGFGCTNKYERIGTENIWGVKALGKIEVGITGIG
jgi:hypothetical protein